MLHHSWFIHFNRQRFFNQVYSVLSTGYRGFNFFSLTGFQIKADDATDHDMQNLMVKSTILIGSLETKGLVKKS